VAFATDLYSASVEDLDTVACFLELQDIKLYPKNIAKPPVDLLSSRHPAQSAYENALTSIEGDFCILSPIPSVYFKYLNILLTVFQCTSVGEFKYWHTLFTEKDISGLVNVKY
jgi:hypothetical protein